MTGELGKFKPGTPRGKSPRRGKRTSSGILARLCGESGAFIEGGSGTAYTPPSDKRDYQKMVTDQYDAVRRAIESQLVRWDLRDRT